MQMKGCTSHSLGNMYLIRAVNQGVQQSKSLQGWTELADGEQLQIGVGERARDGGSNEKIPREEERVWAAERSAYEGTEPVGKSTSPTNLKGEESTSVMSIGLNQRFIIQAFFQTVSIGGTQHVHQTRAG